MILKETYNACILDELNTEVKDMLGFDLKFTQKEMNLDLLNQLTGIPTERKMHTI